MVPEQVWDWHFCSYRMCVSLFFVLFFVSPCLVLSVASWGSVSLAVSSSSWERRFLYSYERYYYCSQPESWCHLATNHQNQYVLQYKGKGLGVISLATSAYHSLMGNSTCLLPHMNNPCRILKSTTEFFIFSWCLTDHHTLNTLSMSSDTSLNSLYSLKVYKSTVVVKKRSLLLWEWCRRNLNTARSTLTQFYGKTD